MWQIIIPFIIHRHPQYGITMHLVTSWNSISMPSYLNDLIKYTVSSSSLCYRVKRQRNFPAFGLIFSFTSHRCGCCHWIALAVEWGKVIWLVRKVHPIVCVSNACTVDYNSLCLCSNDWGSWCTRSSRGFECSLSHLISWVMTHASCVTWACFIPASSILSRFFSGWRKSFNALNWLVDWRKSRRSTLFACVYVHI